MENLKFRLKVRKFKCGDCDTISLIEFKQPLEGLYSCPVCYEPMEYIDDLMVVQEMESNELDDKNIIISHLRKSNKEYNDLLDHQEKEYEQLKLEAETNITHLVKKNEELQMKLSKLNKCCILIGLTEGKQNDLLNLLDRPVRNSLL